MTATANPNLRNGVYSSTYLRSLEPEGDFLLVKPAGGLIGYLGKQRIYSNAYPYLREAAKRFRARTGRALYVLEAWRSMDTQDVYWGRYQAGTGNLAAYPGTSNHGLGIAFDLASNIDSWHTEEHRAFAEVAAPLGFTFPVKTEAWHADWDSSKVTSNDWAGSGATPIPSGPTPGPEPEPNYGENDMPFLIGKKTSAEVAIVGVPGPGVYVFPSIDAYNLCRNVHNDNQARLAGPGDGYPWPTTLANVGRYDDVAYLNVLAMYDNRR